MPLIRSRSNRRAERRYHFGSGQALRWRRCQHGARGRQGWLRDISLGGLSFIANTDRSPHVGQAIDIRTGKGCNMGSFQVVRVHPSDGGMTIVGCEKEPLSPEPVSIPIGDGGITFVKAAA